jgi:hypothetical protein
MGRVLELPAQEPRASATPLDGFRFLGLNSFIRV